MTSAHQLAGLLVLVLAVAVAVVGSAAIVGRWRARLADRLILASLVAAFLASATGGIVWATGAPVRDPLHIVYGVAALLVLPVARYAGRQGTPRRRGVFVAAGGLVLVAVWLRLWMTGAG